MKRSTKKAAIIAAFGYISVSALGLGLLKTAQQTRRTLYGGAPVLAQIRHEELPEQPRAYTLTLGGGEWELHFAPPDLTGIAEAAGTLPPTAGKLMLRLLWLTDMAAGQTAECMSGGK